MHSLVVECSGKSRAQEGKRKQEPLSKWGSTSNRKSQERVKCVVIPVGESCKRAKMIVPAVS